MAPLLAIVTPILFFMALWGVAATWYAVRANRRIAELEENEQALEDVVDQNKKLKRDNILLIHDNRKLEGIIAVNSNKRAPPS